MLHSGQEESSKEQGRVARLPPRQIERLRPSESSRPASDTDDTMWEELLQGPDSASSGSSDSDEETRPSHVMPVPIVLTSEDDSFQQVCH